MGLFKAYTIKVYDAKLNYTGKIKFIKRESVYMKIMKELYRYREMIFRLVKRDLKGRYKGSLLGFLWTFINPLLQLIVYTMVFSTILRSGVEDYYIYLFVALVPWIFFSTSVSSGASVIWTQQDMVKKIFFPRIVLPISFVTAQFVNMILSFIVVIIVLEATKYGYSIESLLYLPIIMLIEYILALGFAMIVSAVTVYLRDLEYLLTIITMAWQFLTPVFYGMNQVPDKILPILLMNPMTPIIIAYRDILYYKQIPNMETLIHACTFSIGIFLIGYVVFTRLQRRFAEVM